MKRYYHRDGRSAPAWFVKPCLLLAFPIFCWIAFWGEVWDGIKSGVRHVRYTWDDLMIEWRRCR